MKYSYSYKTSDGARHEGECRAASKADVYDALRERGIKAFGVKPAPGLWNRLSGISWLWFAVAALAVVAAVASVAYLRERAEANAVEDAGLLPKTRRQVIGDAAVVDKGIATGWSDVFQDEGERFFASFAIPGVRAGQCNTTKEELEAALARSIAPAPGDGMEMRQIKVMVEGMKDEARAYIAAGGTVAGYGRRLVERQDAEIAIYERTRKEIDLARETMRPDEFLAFWEVRNDRLRNLGIRLVPLE